MKTPALRLRFVFAVALLLCFLTTARAELFTWGYNAAGQLGDGTKIQRTEPVSVNVSGALAGRNVVAVSAGGGHSLALTADGLAFTWGYNLSGQLPDGSMGPLGDLPDLVTPVQVRTDNILFGREIIAVEAGHIQSYVITSDGRAYGWGYGHLGDGASDASANNGTRWPTAANRFGPLEGKRLVQVAAGSHCIGLTGDGEMVAWGNGGFGGIGDGTLSNRPLPVCVFMGGEMAGLRVQQVAAGGGFSLALTTTGRVFGWGANYAGQIGDGTTTLRTVPVAVSDVGVLAGKTVRAIAAGQGHALALTSDGQVVAWGSNEYGDLGDGSTATSRNVPGLVTMDGALAGRTVAAIAAGGGTSYALTADGRLFAWGYNAEGQLGDGTTTNRRQPVAVKMDGALAGRVITAISAGESHCLALTGGAPEIAVEAPAGTALADGGGSLTFTPVLTGAASMQEITVRNVGSAGLSGIQVTITGTAAADFNLTTPPAATVSLLGSAAFTVRFAPATPGTKTAVLQIASNDADENPFDITLTGRALAPEADDDGDGLTNAAEVLLAASGADPLADNAALAAQLRAAGLYRAADMGTLALGAPVLERQPGTGNFVLRLGVEQSPDLTNWTPLPGTVDFTITPAGPAPQFFRVLGRKP